MMNTTNLDNLTTLREKIRRTTSVEEQRKLLPAIAFYRLSDHLEEELEIDIPNRVSWDETWDDLPELSTGFLERIQEFYKAIEEENEFVNNPFDLEDLKESDNVTDKVMKRVIWDINKQTFRKDKEHISKMYSEFIRDLIADDRTLSNCKTDQNVSELIGELIDPEEGSKIHDPTIGTSESLRHLQIKSPDSTLTGQEINPEITSIAESNLILSGAKPDIRVGDSLSDPKFTEEDELTKFDIVVSHFPFSQSWEKEELKNDEYNRFFRTEKLPPKNRGDYAFLQHQIAQMNNEGKGAAIIPAGMLFRKRESVFREALIEDDLIESIITLPKGTFSHTSIEGALVILNKDKPEERKNQVQLIPGAEHIQNLQEKNVGWHVAINRFKTEYDEWSDGVGRIVDSEEIRENDYNLNLALYIDTTKEKETEDLDTLIQEVEELAKEQQNQNQKMVEKLEEIR